MDETHVMLVLTGFAAGLIIAVAALVAMGQRNQPPVIVMPPPPPPSDGLGCGGILIFMALMVLALAMWLLFIV